MVWLYINITTKKISTESNTTQRQWGKSKKSWVKIWINGTTDIIIKRVCQQWHSWGRSKGDKYPGIFEGRGGETGGAAGGGVREREGGREAGRGGEAGRG